MVQMLYFERTSQPRYRSVYILEDLTECKLQYFSILTSNLLRVWFNFKAFIKKSSLVNIAVFIANPSVFYRYTYLFVLVYHVHIYDMQHGKQNMKKTLMVISILSILAQLELLVDYFISIYTFKITGSKGLISMILSIKSVPTILFGMIIGITIDHFSRKFCFLYSLILAFTVNIILLSYIVLFNPANYVFLVIYLFIFETISIFSSIAIGSILYDISNQKVSKIISYKSIVTIVLSFVGSGILYFINKLEFELFIIVVVNIFYMIIFVMFYSIKYQDTLQTNALKFKPLLKSIIKKNILFLRTVKKDTELSIILTVPIIKTVFLYWPLVAGILLKFGIEHKDTREKYILIMVLIKCLLTIFSYTLKDKKHYTLNSFFMGILLGGVGLIVFSLTNNVYIFLVSLFIMFVGNNLSQFSWEFIIRKKIHNKLRSHAFTVAVMPYYFADILSGLLFGLLIPYLNVDQLLFICGIGLSILCLLYLMLKRGVKI